MSDRDEPLIPEGWKHSTLGQVSECVLGGTPSTEIPQYWGGSIPWMASGDVHLRRIQDVPGRITTTGLRSSNATLTEPPAVAVGLAGQGKTRGTVALTLCTLSTNQSIALLKGNGTDLHTEYLFHNLDRRYEELRARSSGGGRGGLSKGILDSVPIALPSVVEQQKITQILDTLDTAIHETESLIAKLKAVKQGLLHDLLTRGIGANGELRPPREEAPELYKESELGWIPREWVTAELGGLLVEPPRNGLYKPAHLIGGGTLMIGQTAFTEDGSVRPELARRAQVQAAELATFGLRAGDLLVSRVFATLEGVGRPVIVPDISEDAVYESNMMRLRAKAGVVSPIILFNILIQPTVRATLRARAFLSNQASINQAGLCSLKLSLPSPTEQQWIEDRFAAVVNRTEAEVKQLAKLRAQKAGLMDDLLTGRVRVTPLLADAAQRESGD